MNEEKPIDPYDCLMILGMHRSGSSLLAGCLHHLGVNLGTNRMAGNGSNEGDAFENPDIVLAHEILFRDLGCRWDMVGSLPEGWMEKRGRRAGRSKTGPDHRTAVFGPWAMGGQGPPAVPGDAIMVKRVVPIGCHALFYPYGPAPGRVLPGSLNQNHGTDPDQARLLWLVYNLDAFRDSHRQHRMLLTYDQLLADPVSALRKISAAFNLDLPCDSLESSRTLTEFVRPEFKHHHIGTAASPSKNELGTVCPGLQLFPLSTRISLWIPRRHNPGEGTVRCFPISPWPRPWIRCQRTGTSTFTPPRCLTRC